MKTKCMKCGGSTKMKTMKTGGSMGIVGMPQYSNDPKTTAGRTLKKGGSLKSVSANQKGLAKLPTAVRNKMGYMKKGGVNKK